MVVKSGARKGGFPFFFLQAHWNLKMKNDNINCYFADLYYCDSRHKRNL